MTVKQWQMAFMEPKVNAEMARTQFYQVEKFNDQYDDLLFKAKEAMQASSKKQQDVKISKIQRLILAGQTTNKSQNVQAQKNKAANLAVRQTEYS